jgi:hypothetical protein
LVFVVPKPGQSWMRGCPLHNSAVMPEVTSFVHLQKQAFADTIVDQCRAHGAANPELLGHRIALLYEGAAALSTSLDDPQPWACAGTAVEGLLDLSATAHLS